MLVKLSGKVFIKQNWLFWCKTEQRLVESVKRERNFYENLFRKIKEEYCENLNEKDVIDIRFWKTVKPLLSDKIKSFEKITVGQNNN